MDKKKFFWQRLLLADKYKEYDFVVSLDSDIYINKNAPSIPFHEIPIGKVAAINERKYFGNYEWRETLQIKNGYERTGQDWYRLSGEIKPYHDHINGGLVIYQPKYHGEIFKKLYDDNINNYMRYHQDDQSIISSFVMDNNMIHWLDQRFNFIWLFWKDFFYPNYYTLDEKTKQFYVNHCINMNYFTHFVSGEDIKYIDI